MHKITRWAPFWVPFCEKNRAGSEVPGAGSEVPGAGSEVPGAGSEVPGAGPSPGSKKKRKSDSATSPPGPSLDSKSSLSVTFRS